MQVPSVLCARSVGAQCGSVPWGIPVAPPRIAPHRLAALCFPVFWKGWMLSFCSKIPLAVWRLSGSKVGVGMLVIAVWGVMNVEAPDTAGPYCPPRSSPRLVFPGEGSTETFICGDVLLEGSCSIGSNLGLEFFGILVIGLGESLDWRKAVCRMAAPRGLAVDRLRHLPAGLGLDPSGEAWGDVPHAVVLINTVFCCCFMVLCFVVWSADGE
jgi:hypothetical protein